MDITRQISDIQVRLRYYETLIKLNSTPEVASAYTALVTVARREAGTPMKDAWSAPPTTRDDQVPLALAYPTPGSDAAMAKAIEVMVAARSTT